MALHLQECNSLHTLMFGKRVLISPLRILFNRNSQFTLSKRRLTSHIHMFGEVKLISAEDKLIRRVAERAWIILCNAFAVAVILWLAYFLLEEVTR
jgi:hypothetical protein